MSDPLIPPTPRSTVIGDVGGPGGAPVFMRREWVDFITRSLVARLGGTNGMSLTELQALVELAADDATNAMQVAMSASAAAGKALSEASGRVDLTEYYLQLLLGRAANHERRIRELEDRTL